jgi:hypothetical protein
VDHPASAPELVRPWRTATLVATAIAVVELVLLIVAGIVLLGRTIAPHVHAAAKRQALAPKRAAAHHTAATAATRPARVRHPAAKLPRSKTNVIVLNGNGVQGAAAEEASLVQARGYRIKRVANAPSGGYAKTLVMYRPGFAGEGRRFARDLNLALVEPLDGMKPAQLHGAQLVVILGASR